VFRVAVNYFAYRFSVLSLLFPVPGPLFWLQQLVPWVIEWSLPIFFPHLDIAASIPPKRLKSCSLAFELKTSWLPSQLHHPVVRRDHHLTLVCETG
jgi:hypothetical protein